MNQFILNHNNKKNLNIRTPFRLSDSTGYFDMNITTVDMVVDNLIGVLSTHIGERVMRPQLGSHLWEYIFEQDTDTLKTKVQNEVRRIVSSYFTGIQILGVDVLTNDQDASAPTSGYRVVLKLQIPELSNDEPKTVKFDINGVNNNI